MPMFLKELIMNENSEKVKMRLLRLNTIPEEAKDYSVKLLLETAEQLKTFVLQYDDSDSAPSSDYSLFNKSG